MKGATARRRTKTSTPDATDAPATYLYCVTAGDPATSIATSPPGLAGMGPVRAFPLPRGLWLVASDAPLSTWGAEAIDARLSNLEWVGARALEHEAVVEHFARRGAVLPMKMLTLFSSDARATAHVARSATKIARTLERLDGRDEWGLRVRLTPEAVRGLAERRAPPVESPARSGAAFLLAKKRAQEASLDARRSARATADDLYQRLAAAADDATRRAPDGATPLLLDAAFLVDRADAERFQAEVDRLTADIVAVGGDVALTGPWPPYNFVREDA